MIRFFRNLKINSQIMTITQSVANGLGILFLYDSLSQFFTVSEISQKLRFSQSKTYRLVRTLSKYGFLQESPVAVQYSLGLNAFRLGFLAQQRYNISVIARLYMEELSPLTKETVLLTAVSGTKGIGLDRVENEEPIGLSSFQPGANLCLHCGASRKVLMAYLPEEDWGRLVSREGLKRYTPCAITGAD